MLILLQLMFDSKLSWFSVVLRLGRAIAFANLGLSLSASSNFRSRVRPSVDAGPRIAVASCAQLGVLGERECGWSVHRLDTISLNGPRREGELLLLVVGRLTPSLPTILVTAPLVHWQFSLLDWWDVIQSPREVSLEGNAAVQFSLKQSCPRDRMRFYHMTILNPFTPSNT